MNIFISNLSNNVEEDDLKQMFVDFGEVESSTIIKDKFSLNTMRFGFVEMPDETEAKNAINQMNGKKYNGRKLTVHKARNRSNDRRKLVRGGGRRSNDKPEMA